MVRIIFQQSVRFLACKLFCVFFLFTVFQSRVSFIHRGLQAQRSSIRSMFSSKFTVQVNTFCNNTNLSRDLRLRGFELEIMSRPFDQINIRFQILHNESSRFSFIIIVSNFHSFSTVRLDAFSNITTRRNLEFLPFYFVMSIHHIHRGCLCIFQTTAAVCFSFNNRVFGVHRRIQWCFQTAYHIFLSSTVAQFLFIISVFCFHRSLNWCFQIANHTFLSSSASRFLFIISVFSVHRRLNWCFQIANHTILSSTVARFLFIISVFSVHRRLNSCFQIANHTFLSSSASRLLFIISVFSVHRRLNGCFQIANHTFLRSTVSRFLFIISVFSVHRRLNGCFQIANHTFLRSTVSRFLFIITFSIFPITLLVCFQTVDTADTTVACINSWFLQSQCLMHLCYGAFELRIPQGYLREITFRISDGGLGIQGSHSTGRCFWILILVQSFLLLIININIPSISECFLFRFYPLLLCFTLLGQFSCNLFFKIMITLKKILHLCSGRFHAAVHLRSKSFGALLDLIHHFLLNNIVLQWFGDIKENFFSRTFFLQFTADLIKFPTSCLLHLNVIKVRWSVKFIDIRLKFLLGANIFGNRASVQDFEAFLLQLTIHSCFQFWWKSWHCILLFVRDIAHFKFQLFYQFRFAFNHFFHLQLPFPKFVLEPCERFLLLVLQIICEHLFLCVSVCFQPFNKLGCFAFHNLFGRLHDPVQNRDNALLVFFQQSLKCSLELLQGWTRITRRSFSLWSNVHIWPQAHFGGVGSNDNISLGVFNICDLALFIITILRIRLLVFLFFIVIIVVLSLCLTHKVRIHRFFLFHILRLHSSFLGPSSFFRFVWVDPLFAWGSYVVVRCWNLWQKMSLPVCARIFTFIKTNSWNNFPH